MVSTPSPLLFRSLFKRRKFNKLLCLRIANDTESKRILWLGVLQEPADNAFPVNKAGDYYYVNTTKLFETIGIDFRRKNCMYDMSRAPENDEAIGGECYKMELRVTDRKQTDTPETEE